MESTSCLHTKPKTCIAIATNYKNICLTSCSLACLIGYAWVSRYFKICVVFWSHCTQATLLSGQVGMNKLLIYISNGDIVSVTDIHSWSVTVHVLLNSVIYKHDLLFEHYKCIITFYDWNIKPQSGLTTVHVITSLQYIIHLADLA